MPRLTETRIKAAVLPARGQTFLRCSELRGFGVRLTPAGKTYIVETHGKRLVLERVGVISFDDAHGMALAAIRAARQGEDVVAAAGRKAREQGHPVTLSDVWKTYVEAGYPKLKGTGRKSATTIATDKNRYMLHLKPHLGDAHVEEIDDARVQRWLDKLPSEGQRSHCLVLLKSLLSFARSRGAATTKPVTAKPSPTRKVQNYLSPAELGALEAVLDARLDGKASPFQVTLIRILMLTGARFGEIAAARWSWLDKGASVIRLPKDKTSEDGREIHLPPAAVALIDSLPRTSSPFMFPSDSERGHVTTVQKVFNKALKQAKLKKVRLHDVRHSFASAAVSAGESLYVVGALLGHRQAQTTQRYAHLERDRLREAVAKATKFTGRKDAAS